MHLMLAIIVFAFFKTANFEEVLQKDTPVFDSSADGSGAVFSSALAEISDENKQLSPETVLEIQDLAKDISHAKGIYREAVSEDDPQIRRSVLRKIAVESESDVMNNILKSFHTDEDKLHLLEQMEFLVHQYDVAVNFATQGGIQVIAPLLFSSDDKIVSSVASVIGSAMQSNPTVQKVAMECHVGRDFLKLLSHQSPLVISRILFALSCLLRNAPRAQEEFLSLDGVSKLAHVLQNSQISTNSKLKIILLFSDLSVEQQTAQLYLSGEEADRMLKLERLFMEEMQRCKICKIIPSFLDFEDFDTHQKIVSAMKSVNRSCRKDFKNFNINNRLKKLLKIYDPDFDGQGPIYPLVDKDLKRALHSDLETLIKEINEESLTLGLLKTEL